MSKSVYTIMGGNPPGSTTFSISSTGAAWMNLGTAVTTATAGFAKLKGPRHKHKYLIATVKGEDFKVKYTSVKQGWYNVTVNDEHIGRLLRWQGCWSTQANGGKIIDGFSTRTFAAMHLVKEYGLPVKLEEQ